MLEGIELKSTDNNTVIDGKINPVLYIGYNIEEFKFKDDTLYLIKDNQTLRVISCKHNAEVTIEGVIQNQYNYDNKVDLVSEYYSEKKGRLYGIAVSRDAIVLEGFEMVLVTKDFKSVTSTDKFIPSLHKLCNSNRISDRFTNFIIQYNRKLILGCHIYSWIMLALTILKVAGMLW